MHKWHQAIVDSEGLPAESAALITLIVLCVYYYSATIDERPPLRYIHLV